jgi:hypothetical protein
MNRFLALVLLALIASNAQAFVVAPKYAALSTSSSPMTKTSSSPFSSTTMLHLKVKVKEEDLKEEKLNPAVFRNAAYLGSIAIALLLPLFFLFAK